LEEKRKLLAATNRELDELQEATRLADEKIKKRAEGVPIMNYKQQEV